MPVENYNSKIMWWRALKKLKIHPHKTINQFSKNKLKRKKADRECWTKFPYWYASEDMSSYFWM